MALLPTWWNADSGEQSASPAMPLLAPEAEPAHGIVNPQRPSTSSDWLRDYEQKLAARDPRVGFELRVGGQTERPRFHAGELIPLDLVFTCSEANAYEVDLGTYDRSGRVNTDRCRFEREGDVVDPLAEYFRTGLFIGGGLSGVASLTPGKEESVTLTLNQYARFDRPGVYRFYVETDRMWPQDEETRLRVGRSHVVSDLFEIEILPWDREWEREEFTEIQQELLTSEVRIERLRHLDTREGIVALVHALLDPNIDSWRLSMGIYGSRHRELAKDSMRRLLEHPNAAITRQFVLILRQLELFDRGQGALPMNDAESALADEIETEILELLRQSLTTKTATAKAACEATITEMTSK